MKKLAVVLLVCMIASTASANSKVWFSNTAGMATAPANLFQDVQPGTVYLYMQADVPFRSWGIDLVSATLPPVTGTWLSYPTTFDAPGTAGAVGGLLTNMAGVQVGGASKVPGTYVLATFTIAGPVGSIVSGKVNNGEFVNGAGDDYITVDFPGMNGVYAAADTQIGNLFRIMPEPATLTLLCISGLALIRRR